MHVTQHVIIERTMDERLAKEECRYERCLATDYFVLYLPPAHDLATHLPFFDELQYTAGQSVTSWILVFWL